MRNRACGLSTEKYACNRTRSLSSTTTTERRGDGSFHVRLNAAITRSSFRRKPYGASGSRSSNDDETSPAGTMPELSVSAIGAQRR